MHRRARLAWGLLLCSGCLGAPRDPGALPQAGRAADVGADALPRMELVPVVPPEVNSLDLPASDAAPWEDGLPFWTELLLPGAGLVQVATTNNSLDPRMAPHRRGFAVCLRADAVRYAVHWRDDLGEVVTTAEVSLQGTLGNCSQMNRPMHYLVLAGRVDGQVAYRVVSSSTGFAPSVACVHPGVCPPLQVTLPALERALGGLKLAGLGSPGPYPPAGAAAPPVALTAVRRSTR